LLITISCTSSKGTHVCDLAPLLPTQTAIPINHTPDTVESRGIIDSIEIHEGYAYVGTNSSLEIVDISDPTNPQLLNQILDGANSTELMSPYLYLPGYRTSIFDISDPTAPVEVHCQNNDSFRFYEAITIGDYAYMRPDDIGLRVLDISDPSALIEMNTYQPKDSRQFQLLPKPKIYTWAGVVADIEIHDNYLYVAEGTVGIDSLGNGSIRVFDISDSDELELVHTYETGTGAGQMKISGNFLFMETGYMNFPSSIILDISDPMNLVEIIPTPSLPDGLIAINGNYAFFVRHRHCRRPGPRGGL
jgi:hypothetical protein